MIVAPKKNKRSADDNILPLINVVFLLLIFFVIAGAITRDAPFDLTLPATSHTQARAAPSGQILSVAADGTLAFKGETIKAPSLDKVLADWPTDKPLQIRADRHLRASKLSNLLNRLREAGITKVRLLTQHQPQ